MQTHDAKRVAIIVESPMQRRLTDAIEASGVTGYTVVPRYRRVWPIRRMDSRRASQPCRGYGAGYLCNPA